MKKFILAAAVATLSTPAFTGPQVSPSDYSRLLAAAGGNGPVCAFYRGRNERSSLTAPRNIAVEACFGSVRECRAWLYDVQTAYPVMFNRKGCGR